MLLAILALSCGWMARPVDAGTAIQTDQTFGPNLLGYNNIMTSLPSEVSAIALKADGTYNGCGAFGPYIIVGQMTAAGNLDTVNFNSPQGYALVPAGAVASICAALATQSGDQKTVFAGEALGATAAEFVVGRLTTAGTLDTTSFGSPNGFTLIDFPTTDSSPDFSTVIGLKIQPADGFIVLGGHAKVQASPFVSQLALARVDTSGVLDVAFGTAGMQTLLIGDTVTSLGVVLQSDAKIVTGGFVIESGLPQVGIARFTTSGVLDSTYGSGAGFIQYTSLPSSAFVTGMDIQYVGANQNKVIIGAASPPTDQVWILRFDTSGNLDTSFGSAGVTTLNMTPGSQPNIVSISVATDGTDNILVAGQNTVPGTSYLAKLGPNGAPDTMFGDYGGPVTGVLTMEQLTRGDFMIVQDAIWDLNSKPVSAGQVIDSVTSLLFSRFLPTNTQSISILSPLNGQPATTNPQVYVNGLCSQMNARIDILVDGTLDFQTVSNGRGQWFGSMTAPLSSGSHTITANLIYDISTIVATASSTITIA